MPVELAPQLDSPLQFRAPFRYPARKLWTRAECQTLESTGLWDRDKLELIEGELLTKTSKKRPHGVVFQALVEWLASTFGIRRVNMEAPIDVAPDDNPTTEPEPDLAVLAKNGPEYMGANPPASDVQLLIEVSSSTLDFDLGPKARLYARAAIQEYWVFDIPHRRLIVHREPIAGVYKSVTAYLEGESVAPLAMPSASLEISAAFPFTPDQVPADEQ